MCIPSKSHITHFNAMAKGQKWNPTSLFDPFVIASAKMLLIFCYQTIMCPQCAKFQKKKSFFKSWNFCAKNVRNSNWKWKLKMAFKLKNGGFFFVTNFGAKIQIRFCICDDHEWKVEKLVNLMIFCLLFYGHKKLHRAKKVAWNIFSGQQKKQNSIFKKES